MAGMQTDPPYDVKRRRDLAHHRVELARDNIKFLIKYFGISIEKLALNANSEIFRLEQILDHSAEITLDEVLMLIFAINDMCDVCYSLNDFTGSDITGVSPKVWKK